MAKFFQVLLLLIVISAMVWASSLWRWEVSHVDPSGDELVLHLVVLPLVLTAALVLAIWLVKKIQETLKAPVEPAGVKPGAGSPAIKLSDKLSAD